MRVRHSLLIALQLIVVGCSSTNFRTITKLNESAVLVGDLPANPLRWSVITSGVDTRKGFMFTLFGNAIAVRYARSSAARDYPAGSVLALVNWRQQEDIRWFGAWVPARPLPVEFVDVQTKADGSPPTRYRVYRGSPLKEGTRINNEADQRTKYLVSLRAAVMP